MSHESDSSSFPTTPSMREMLSDEQIRSPLIRVAFEKYELRRADYAEFQKFGKKKRGLFRREEPGPGASQRRDMVEIALEDLNKEVRAFEALSDLERQRFFAAVQFDLSRFHRDFSQGDPGFEFMVDHVGTRDRLCEAVGNENKFRKYWDELNAMSTRSDAHPEAKQFPFPEHLFSQTPVAPKTERPKVTTLKPPSYRDDVRALMNKWQLPELYTDKLVLQKSDERIKAAKLLDAPQSVIDEITAESEQLMEYAIAD